MKRLLPVMLKKRIATLPATLSGTVTAVRVQRLLEEEGINVSLSTIARVWRETGVSPRAHPRFDNGHRGHLFHLLAKTSPNELGLDETHWTLGRFRKYLQLVGLVDQVSRKTIAHFLDDSGVERPSDLWPRPSPLLSKSG